MRRLAFFSSMEEMSCPGHRAPSVSVSSISFSALREAILPHGIGVDIVGTASSPPPMGAMMGMNLLRSRVSRTRGLTVCTSPTRRCHVPAMTCRRRSG